MVTRLLPRGRLRARAPLLFLRAVWAERGNRHMAASRHYLTAAALLQPAGRPADEREAALFRAVQELERSQDWRMVAGLWDHLGDLLGDDIYDRDPCEPEQSALLHKYYLPQAYWDDPRPDDTPPGYYRDEDAKKAHRQAWAYAHGAEEASANRRFALSTLLHRKAAFAWRCSKWGDRLPSDAGGDWTEEMLYRHLAGKWEQAARAHFRAALYQLESSAYDEKGETFGTYRAETVRWPWAGTPIERGADLADVDELLHCWHEWGEAREKTANTPAEVRRVRISALSHAEAHLETLQEALVRLGRRKDAVRLHRENAALGLALRRERIALSHATASRSPLSIARRGARWIGFALATAYDRVTGSGTSAARVAAAVGFVYLVAFPLLFYGFGLVRGDVAHADSPVRASFGDTVLFSLANAVTVDVHGLASQGEVGAIVQTLHAVFAYFCFGYVIWVLLRPYEQ